LKEYLTVTEVARATRIPAYVIRRACKAGTLKAIQPGRLGDASNGCKYWIHSSEVKRFLGEDPDGGENEIDTP